MCLNSTQVVSIIGFLLMFLYFFLIRKDKCNEELRSVLRNGFNQLNICEHKDFILRDYVKTNEEIARRENITLVIGSILVTSSF